MAIFIIEDLTVAKPLGFDDISLFTPDIVAKDCGHYPLSQHTTEFWRVDRGQTAGFGGHFAFHARYCGQRLWPLSFITAHHARSSGVLTVAKPLDFEDI